MRISVVIPVYNEVETIREILNRVQNVDVVNEIIVVDDASNDGTTPASCITAAVKTMWTGNQRNSAAIVEFCCGTR